MKRMNAHIVNKALRGLKWLGCAARDLQVTRCGRVALSGALAISLSPDLFATEMDIRAEFQPDSARPHHNAFVNKTPNNGGYCRYYPANCEYRGIYSISAPVHFNNVAPILAHHADPRQGAMITVPGEWRTLTVTHAQTLETEEVRVRIIGFGTTMDTSPRTIHDLVPNASSWFNAYNRLWSGQRWSLAPAPCIGKSTALYDATQFIFFWETPVSTTACGKQALYDIPYMTFRTLDFSYELQTPNPLHMSSGEYTGRMTYTIGPYQDFDMGDVLIPSDTLLTLNFSLGVSHTLKVDVPPGGNFVELVPKGGWHQWMFQGRAPEKLYRDQTFLISASSRFQMSLQCQYVIGDTCALDNKQSHRVPLDILVTLPNGLGREGGSAVNRQPLLLSGAGTQLFQPNYYVDRRQATLHFEIQKQHVKDMLFQEGTYSGNVVVIWDSEV